jgi:3-methyladenine DNA glycosylase AlkD
MKYQNVKNELRKYSSLEKAKKAKRFFKTAPGQYSATDVFIGVTTPEIRKIAKSSMSVSFDVLNQLLLSPIHEERHLAVIILVDKFKASDFTTREKIFRFYLKMKNRINNWDLVDTSAASILGDFSFENNSFDHMNKLINSKRHWDRRKAMVATHAFIKKGKLDLTFLYAKKILNDKEDLMHKAAGWMLREAGKKNKKSLRMFIHENGSKMPRTMLRYAIEHFTTVERKKILNSTKA